MKFNVIYCLPFLILLALHSATCWRSFKIYFSNITCSKKSDIVSYVNCSIVKLNRHENSCSLYAETAQDLFKPSIDFILSYPRSGQADFIGINATKLDACAFLEAKISFNLLQIIRNDFNKYANLPEKCPIPKGTRLSIIKYRFSAENLPPYMLDHIFSMRILLWSNTTRILEVVVKGSVEAKRRGKESD